MVAGDDLRNRLRAIELERASARAELAGIEARRKALAATVKDCDRRFRELVADLVVDRPLIDLAEDREAAREEAAVSAPEPAPAAIEEEPAPAPVYTWHHYSIEKLIPVDRHRTAQRLADWGAHTVGELAEWLRNGNFLEDLAEDVDGDGPFDVVAIAFLRKALRDFILQQGIEAEFPLAWLYPEGADPAKGGGKAGKPRKPRKAKAKPAPEPPAGELPVFGVRSKRAATFSHFVRARSLKEANDFVMATRSAGSTNKAFAWDGPPPKGAWVQTAGPRPSA